MITVAASRDPNATPSPSMVISGSDPSSRRLKDGFNSTADFLLVGGASIAAAVLLGILQWSGLQNTHLVSTHLANLAPMFATIALLVNYPHAVWSYRLAYQQGADFIVEHKFALIGIPVLIVAALSLVFINWTTPMSQMAPLIAVDQFLQKFGVFTNATVYQSFGAFLFAYLLIFQMIVSGRHYVYQSYGVALACSAGQGYSMTLQQRNFLRYNMLALWVMNIMSGYKVFNVLKNMSFQYFSPRLPEFVIYASYAAFFVTTYLVWSKVVWPIKKETGKWPPLNVTVSIVSAYLWLQPFWFPFAYQLWIVPLAHSAQYLHFVQKVEKNNFAGLTGKAANSEAVDKQNRGPLFFFILIALVMLIGFLGFEAVPRCLDEQRLLPLLTANFWVIAFNVFINVQHYYIDGVVWRSRNSRVRSLLTR